MQSSLSRTITALGFSSNLSYWNIVGIKYSVRDLICDVINYRVWSCNQYVW